MNPAEVRFVVDPPARLLAAAVLLRAIVNNDHGCALDAIDPTVTPIRLGCNDCEIVDRDDVIAALELAKRFVDRNWDYKNRFQLSSLFRASVWMLLRRGDSEPQGAA